MKAKLGTVMIICILVSFTFGACFNMSAGSMLNYRLRHIGDNDTLVNESSSKSFETIRKAVEEKDSDAIYELFSKTAKDSGVTKESIDELIEILHGNLETWEDLGTANVSEKIDYGKRSITYANIYHINIDSEEYTINMMGCVRDDKNSDNIGLMCLTLFFRTQDLGIPGEYEIGRAHV